MGRKSKEQIAREIKEKAKELRRQSCRDWRKRNPEKVKMYWDRYWERKAAAALGLENPNA